MYKDGIPASIINTFLSLDDLESIQQEDGNIIYAVGGYAIIDDAINKQYKLEEKGFDIGETKIIVDNNGVVSDYVPPAPKIINSSNIITDTVGYFQDVQKTLESLHFYCNEETRIVISYFLLHFFRMDIYILENFSSSEILT